jgi:hypothetical protein
MPDEDKVRENRLRRIAERRGYSLEKSRRRDPKAPDFARFRVIEMRENRAVFGAEPHAFSATLDEVEQWLGEKPDGGTVTAEFTQVFKKIEALEREFAQIEDELGLARSSRDEAWTTRLERIRNGYAKRQKANP